LTRLRIPFGAAPELIVLGAALVVGCLGVLLGLPLVLPDASALLFVEHHYFRPLVVAVVIQAAMVAFGRARGGPDQRLMSLVPALLLLPVTIFVHFNLKAWMPLVHRRFYDVELIATDRGLGPVVSLLFAVRRALAAPLARMGVPVGALYHEVFVGMFFVAFSAHAVFDSLRGLRRVVLGMCLILLVGGLCYWVFPARGPFLFRLGESRLAEEAQADMLALFQEFVRTGRPPPGYFVEPLAAMPSLHAAHAAFFTLLAYRRLRWLALPFGLILTWIVIEAVSSGWHYLLDLPAGMLLAAGTVWLLDRVLPDA
jgi:hypothetical protein